MNKTSDVSKQPRWAHLGQVGLLVLFVALAGCFMTGGAPDLPEVVAGQEVYLLELTPL